MVNARGGTLEIRVVLVNLVVLRLGFRLMMLVPLIMLLVVVPFFTIAVIIGGGMTRFVITLPVTFSTTTAATMMVLAIARVSVIVVNIGRNMVIRLMQWPRSVGI